MRPSLVSIIPGGTENICAPHKNLPQPRLSPLRRFFHPALPNGTAAAKVRKAGPSPSRSTIQSGPGPLPCARGRGSTISTAEEISDRRPRLALADLLITALGAGAQEAADRRGGIQRAEGHKRGAGLDALAAQFNQAENRTTGDEAAHRRGIASAGAAGALGAGVGGV